MRILTVLAIAIGLMNGPILSVVATGLAADPPARPAPSIRKSVEALIEQLDSSTLSERTQAERALLDLGPEVLTYLPAPELTRSVAVRESVKRIRVQLERRAARESAQASRITLSGSLPLNQILTEIAHQTRNRVELAKDVADLATQTIDVAWDQTPFWEALDEVGRKQKLQAVFHVSQGVLQLQPPGSKSNPELVVQRSGPYRLAIHSAEVRPIVGNPTHHLLRVSGKVSLEPRLRPLFLHFAAADVTASNLSGRGLDPWNPSATYELPCGDAGRDVAVQFDYLIPNNLELASFQLRGRLAVQLAAGIERIVFDQTSQTPGASRRRGGVTVRLREVRFEPLAEERLNAELKVTVGYDAGGPAFESHRTWMFHNAVYFEDAMGTRFDFTEYDTSLQVDGAVGVDYRWDKLHGPATQYHFVYEAPTLILDLPLEVKLDSIPIKSVTLPAP